VRGTRVLVMGILQRIGRRVSGQFKKENNGYGDTAAFVRVVPSILTLYAELLEKYPLGFIDETWLPVDKDSMKGAFKAAWILAENDDGRQWIQDAWMSLSMFQPGVGDAPVMCAILGGVVNEDMNILNGWKLLARIGQAEEETIRAEIRAFVSRQRTKMYAA
jgi:hypothetical protein